MAVSVSCSSCNFPIAAEKAGQNVKCPYCGQKGETVYSTRPVQISKAISSPGASEFLLGMAVGVIFSVPIIAAVKSGTDALARLAKEKIK